MIEADLLVFLKADATLTTLLAGRIYPKMAAQRTAMPYIVYNVTTSPDGELLKEDRFEFRIHATKDSQVASIRNRLATILDKQDAIRGVITSASFYIFHSEWTGTVPLTEKENLADPEYIEVLIYQIKFKSYT